MNTKPLTPTFGLSIGDLDLRDLDLATADHLRRLLYTHKVLCIRNVTLSETEYVSLARTLGNPVLFVDPEYRHPDHPEIFVVSNVRRDGKTFGKDRVGYYWHSDSSFMPEPLPVTMLHVKICPDSGGQTAFIDMQQVYAQLPDWVRHAINGRSASHEGKWKYLVTAADVGLSIEEILDRDEALVPSQVHPMVLTHPVTGHRAIYVSEGVTRRVLDVDEIESGRILGAIWDSLRMTEARYVHSWEKGDLVLWDNRSVVHRAYPADIGQSRQMFRIGIVDGTFFGERQ